QYFLTVRSENYEFPVDIKVVGKALIKTGVGTFDAIATRVKVKGGPDYDLRIFFSDDEWHVPVMVTAHTGDADVKVELAGSALEAPATVPAKTGTRQTVEPGIPTPTPTPMTSVSRGSAADPPRETVPILDLPFKVGEQLNYQVYLGKSTQSVGTL